ncbi:hypothetical protein [Pseudanabaena sp. UWO310]|nr:hypothetical protein [Pseudanabaena sp. UWO310]
MLYPKPETAGTIQFIGESGEGLEFAIEIVMMRLGIMVQMANFY